MHVAKMATRVSSMDKPQQEDNDMLCTICLELKKDPRLLPCLHSYCKGCLEKILSKSTRKLTLSCPQCRVDHVTPREEIAGLPQDQVLARTIQAHITKTVGGKPRRGTGKMTDSPRQCTMCTEDDPATSFCSTCGKFLCEFCQKAHKRLVDFRDHKYTPLSELDQVDKLVAMAELPSYCTLHSGEVLKLYCKTCQKVICRDCTIVNHRDHEYGFINELRPQVQEGVKTTIARLKARQKEFEANLAFLRDVEASRNAHADMLEAQITAAFQSYIETLKTRQAELLSIEQASKDGDLKQIWAQKQHIKTTLANLSSAIRYAERLCACPSDKMMLTMQGETTARLNSLQCTTWNASSVEISVPNTFSKTELRPSEAGMLEPDLVSVSVTLEGSGSTPSPVSKQMPGGGYMQMYSEKYILLGETLQYVISSSKSNSHIIPSISIRTGTGHCVTTSYATQYRGSGVWSLAFTPPYAGRFTTEVSINNAHPKGTATAYPLRPGVTRKAHYKVPRKRVPITTVSHMIHVTGILKVGDVVCRGPHWQAGDEDGGVGGLGTVTEIPNQFTRQFTVKWENGRVGTYKAQNGSFEIELASPTEPGKD